MEGEAFWQCLQEILPSLFSLGLLLCSLYSTSPSLSSLESEYPTDYVFVKERLFLAMIWDLPDTFRALPPSWFL
jgi:hypothetical protein